MKVHLKQIPAQGLHLRGEEDCPLTELGVEDIRCAGPLTYDLEVGMSGGALWANGSLKQPVELQCVSCLEKFKHVVDVPGFALHIDLTGPESIDLTPFVREDILLNLPPHPRCDRDAGRVCKAAPPPKPAKEVKRKPDWSALDKLKLNR